MVDLSMAYSMSLRGSHFKLVGWYTYPSEKSDFVSWDYELPILLDKIKVMFQSAPSDFISRYIINSCFIFPKS